LQKLLTKETKNEGVISDIQVVERFFLLGILMICSNQNYVA
jgi:hypothetical protein